MSFIPKPLQAIVNWVSSGQKKLVYQLYEGSSTDAALLSSKFANLCDLHRHGLKTPPAFILTIDAAHDFVDNDRTITERLIREYTHHIIELERQTGKKFGCNSGVFPLLLCARVGVPQKYQQVSASFESDKEPVNFRTLHGDDEQILDTSGIFGAPESWCCPGVMETVVSIGLNDEVAQHLSVLTDKRFAQHTYAHFLFRFGCIVLKASPSSYHRVLTEVTKLTGRSSSQMNESDLAIVIEQFKKIQPVPDNPWDQLRLTIKEIYMTWFHDKVRLIREDTLLLSSDLYPTICIQAVAFGDLAIVFTRNPLTGVKGIFGDYWPISGGKMPLSNLLEDDQLKKEEFSKIADFVEEHFKDMQDIELIVDSIGNILVLQVRPGRRSAIASMKIAVDMVHEKVLTEREALMKVDPSKCKYFLLPQVAVDEEMSVDEVMAGLAEGIPASHGAVSGVIAFTAEDCLRLSLSSDVIYFCESNGTCNLNTFMACKAAVGVVTFGGTMLSDIAIICRNLAKPCIVSLSADIEYVESMNETEKPQLHSGSRLIFRNGDVLCSGDSVTVDGSHGVLYLGLATISSFKMNPNLMILLKWADKYRKIRIEATIKATGNFIEDIKYGGDMGADGFCVSTDQLLFYTKDRLTLTRLILFTQSSEERQQYLTALTQLHKEDFTNIFREVAGRPICIKLLDRFLHYTMPCDGSAASQMALSMNRSVAEVKAVTEIVNNKNPSFGLRGCRISAVYPYFTEMQIRALIFAIIETNDKNPFSEPIRIAIPMVNSDHELKDTRRLIEETVKEALNELNIIEIDGGMPFTIGIIIGSPRACALAGCLTPLADFIYLNLEDLTASSFSSSQEDADKYLPAYLKGAVLRSNPFKQIDEKGVGLFAQTALNFCQLSDPKIACGAVEGDQTGDPGSINFLCESGFQLASCAPIDLAITRIAAAQASIRLTSAVAERERQTLRTHFKPAEVTFRSKSIDENKIMT